MCTSPSNICARVWDCEKANIENIKEAISNFDWNKTFENLSLDGKVEFLKQNFIKYFEKLNPK